MPDGGLVPIPIPVRSSPTCLGDLQIRGCDVAGMMEDLSGGRLAAAQHVHLDPDLDHDALAPRPEGWRGAFGQAGSAQGHLARQGVSKGDLFLFFGWFREAERRRGRWRYVDHAPDLHVIFGWLVVGEVIDVNREGVEGVLSRYPWLSRHPHLDGAARKNDVVYVAADEMPGWVGASIRGYGVFERLVDDLVLTDRGQDKRSVWRLPEAFMPKEGRKPMTYHGERSWKSMGDGTVTVQTVSRGQEFVVDLETYPGVKEWVQRVLASVSGSSGR